MSMHEIKVGDRVESTAGDDFGERGTVVQVVLSDQLPIHWENDNGGYTRCRPERVRVVQEWPELVKECHAWLLEHAVWRSDGDLLVPTSGAAAVLLAGFVAKQRRIHGEK